MKAKIAPRKSLERRHAGWSLPEDRRGKLRLDMNENLLGCSAKARAALRTMSVEDFSAYPEMRNAMKRMASLLRVRPEELILTGGIDDALRLIADAFIEKGRTVLLTEPTFPMYRFYAEQRDARICSPRYDEELRFPLASVLKVLRSGPAVFFLANPNNPTGTLLSKRDLAKILDAATRTLIVVDEAYFEYADLTTLPWIRRRRNLAVTRTFSKAAGLAGLRIGCIIAHPDVTDILRRAESPYPVSAASLAAAEATLQDRAFLRSNVREILRSREFVEMKLSRLGVRVFPSAASFVLADFGAAAPRIVAGLAERGILVSDRTRDFRRPGFVRITMGARGQMARLLRELEPLL